MRFFIIIVIKSDVKMENIIDTCLIFEDRDERILGGSNIQYKDNIGFFGAGDDIGAQWSFGSTIEQQLNSLGKGYSSSVTDFGSEVVVKVKYNNVKTGSSATATFLIKFNSNKSGVIKSNAVRYRTFTTHSDILSYIRARANVLKQKTQGNG